MNKYVYLKDKYIQLTVEFTSYSPRDIIIIVNFWRIEITFYNKINWSIFIILVWEKILSIYKMSLLYEIFQEVNTSAMANILNTPLSTLVHETLVFRYNGLRKDARRTQLTRWCTNRINYFPGVGRLCPKVRSFLIVGFSVSATNGVGLRLSSVDPLCLLTGLRRDRWRPYDVASMPSCKRRGNANMARRNYTAARHRKYSHAQTRRHRENVRRRRRRVTRSLFPAFTYIYSSVRITGILHWNSFSI